MEYFFSAFEGLKERFTTNTLFVFDFDGTLAPIVVERDAAALSAKTTQQLTKLAKMADVAVVSGRALDNLRERLPIPTIKMVGNHGIESPQIFSRALNHFDHLCRGWKRQLSALRLPWASIEDKRYSLTIHCRPEDTAKAMAFCEKLKPFPRLVGGKSCINLIPPEAPHKGTATAWLWSLSNEKHLVYVGDDVTDEDVFSLEHPHFTTIRVGELANSKAMYFIKQQSEINQLLSAFMRHMELVGTKAGPSDVGFGVPLRAVRL